MSRIVIKVCGITEERDAVEAALLGVDAVGFDFNAASSRYVDPAVARRIGERLPVFVSRVGVFADTPLIEVLEVARSARLSTIQLHGGERPEFCAALAPFSWYKAIRVDADFVPQELERYPCGTFLLDAGDDGSSGFEWRRARNLSLYGRILISGGLDPVNVGLAIEDARPYGVDATSAVEVAPGKKDLNRLEAFVEAVRRVERRLATGDKPTL